MSESLPLRERAISAAIAQRNADENNARAAEADRYSRLAIALAGELRRSIGLHVNEDELTRDVRAEFADRPVYVDDGLMFWLERSHGNSDVLRYTALCTVCQEPTFELNAIDLVHIGRQLENHNRTHKACLEVAS